MLRTIVTSAAFATLAALVACSSSASSSSSSGGSDTDAGDSGTTPAADAGDDGGDVVNACRTYTDHTADGDTRTIPWDFTVSTSPARCMKIKAGQSVTWQGSFGTHPLEASGGDPANPIAGADQTGAAATVAFPVAGTYGYKCANHPAMLGAIEVTGP